MGATRKGYGLRVIDRASAVSAMVVLFCYL